MKELLAVDMFHSLQDLKDSGTHRMSAQRIPTQGRDHIYLHKTVKNIFPFSVFYMLLKPFSKCHLMTQLSFNEQAPEWICMGLQRLGNCSSAGYTEKYMDLVSHCSLLSHVCTNLFAEELALNMTPELVDPSAAVPPDDSEEIPGVVTALVPVACAELSLAIAATSSVW